MFIRKNTKYKTSNTKVSYKKVNKFLDFNQTKQLKSCKISKVMVTLSYLKLLLTTHENNTLQLHYITIYYNYNTLKLKKTGNYVV